ncbi:glutathione S-transferase family protein [Rhodococcus zopfii]|uniref:glutathione S-transferase family protein n=1 Tax=Rhodococcus zopfii TaxID=43772 RepID=UPI000934DD18|nr:glutathione S-transferase family protein [Rhodococcus zopfii]
MTETVLHDFPLDARCYAARLALSILQVEHRVRSVDVYPGREHLGATYRALTPAGLLPVLESDDVVAIGTADVLTHLARAHDPAGTWIGSGVDEWLAFATGPLETLYATRDIALYTTEPLDTGDAVAALRTLDDHLAVQRLHGFWVVGEHPTVADLALYPAAALSRDIGIDHDTFPALRHWLRRVKSLPGFVEMPGIPVFP